MLKNSQHAITVTLRSKKSAVSDSWRIQDHFEDSYGTDFNTRDF